MKSKLLFVGFYIAMFLISACNNPKKTVGKTQIDKKVEALLAKMTLEEKIGQMNQYNGFWDVTGPSPALGDAKKKYDDIKNGMVGSMLNVRGVENVRKIQKIAVEGSRLGIPLLFGSDVIHGYKTLAPVPLAEASSWDLKAIERSARNAAIEASAVGVNWTFAPMVDISRDARWGRVMEGAGEDPFLGSKIAEARVKGFQGDDLSAPNTIVACAKHFAGYGFAEAGRDYNTVDVGNSTLYNVIFPPFKAAVEADVKTVMNSFNILNGIPATGNKFLQRDILKGKWGFDGFVISDWASISEMVAHGFAKDLKDATEIAIKAGNDMDMESYGYVKYLAGLVKAGTVDEALVDDAVRRILRVKFELGLFDDPYRYCDEQREKTMLYNKGVLNDALEMAKRSIVLLKNSGKLLPLNSSQKRIAVIGSLANDNDSPLGSWRIGSDDNSAISVLQGLKNHNVSFSYSKGADLYTEKPSFTEEVKINTTDKSGFKDAISLARNSEVVIMVLGEHGFQSGEGRSRTDLGLPGVQQELLEEIYRVNHNIVLVLMNGRPLVLNWADEHIPAILEAWQLGTQTGNAIAQVLFGDYNPSGKLPMSFPRSVGQVPIYYNHYSTGRGDETNTVFWSHYIDTPNTPLYPFGYGLSYSNFKYSNLKVDVIDNNNNKVKVALTVTNTSEIAGEEVTQLYIHDKFASLARPVKELKGFKKFLLKPNESREIVFELGSKELGFYNSEGDFIVEKGAFDVMVGTNSRIGLTGEFNLN